MSKPLNILFLMTDQHRADHVSWHPNARHNMPHLNRLSEGCIFDNCVSVNPVCMPARTALLTGKYSHQIGTRLMSGELNPDHPTYFQALQKAGYYTAAIGKLHWHQGWPWSTEMGMGYNHIENPELATCFGLDYVYEVCGKQLAQKNYCRFGEKLDQLGYLEDFRNWTEEQGCNLDFPSAKNFDGQAWPYAEEAYSDILTGNHLVETFKNRPMHKPFCIFGSFCCPHPPYDAPERFLEKIPQEEIDDFIQDPDPMAPGIAGDLPSEIKSHLYKLRRNYKAMLDLVDEQIGKVLAVIEEAGELENTVILFTADHGEMMGDHGRFQKKVHYKESVIVPTAIRHPHFLNHKRYEEAVELTDLTATILDVAQLNPQDVLSKDWPMSNNSVPCRSLLPVLKDGNELIRDFAFSEGQEWQMIRTKDFKFIHYTHLPIDENPDELYDLSRDPDEVINVAEEDQYAKILKRMQRQLQWTLDQTQSAQHQYFWKKN